MAFPEPRPAERFSNRVEHYIRARPGYPPALFDFFRADLGLIPTHCVADIGSGTGLLTEMFLKNGNAVLGVEPNAAMRQAAERLLAHYPNFRSVDASAEATTLPNHSVNFVVAGQAFHWFDRNTARVEFMRVLSPGGFAVLVWNNRRKTGSGLDQAYDDLISRFAIDSCVDHHTTHSANADEIIGPFFGPRHFKQRCFDNCQDLDLAGLQARLLSSSYLPAADHPSFTFMMLGAQDIFQKYSSNGLVRITYDTLAYYGTMS